MNSMNSTNATSGNDELEAAVSRLWREHEQAPFPAGLRGAERADIDLVLLDADIAGCVSSWLSCGGSLDDRRRSVLHRRITDLDQILPVLGAADNAPYRQRLYRLSRLVSGADPRPAK
ncbi:hypothetical protein [Streptomyces sp. st140]|uniref:hypothetical protein n=1 Tax=Streptomyces sp. st140 TaxID=1828052 RepID=UPI00211D8A42|nr:hypothetical protein [Streptomyces sp. st140]